MDTKNLGFIDNDVPPSPYPPQWSSSWGQDQFGLWASLMIEGVEQVMRWIRPGRFLMGSPDDEPERNYDETLHDVVISHGFWLADTACTQVLWTKVMGDNPSHFKGDDQLPVENVSWNDCQKFLRTANGKLNRPKLKIPTEAQWEYGCRAGTQTSFSLGENITTDQVNYNGHYPYADGPKGEYREASVAVKDFPCNQWGLYQMHGNVREWCADRYDQYPEGSRVDPKGLGSGGLRVLRGGSWIGSGGYARPADRSRVPQDYFSRDFGFRFSLV
ncbi:formylglycine-generating enzyme family protein [Maridesulfovibrio sp. FT414]|uniref:formylglycine-generating enzyme family protein n=1 Tax=Maridesulfovibrio sp. FT414 TaxID=2979469 RepID=UPI003D80824C